MAPSTDVPGRRKILGDADAVERLALDVLDAVDGGGGGALEGGRDAVRDLFGREARVAVDHRDHRMSISGSMSSPWSRA